MGEGDGFGEADDAEVAGVDTEDGGGVWADGALVVAEAGLVGGADFFETGAGGLEDFGEAEAAADLDELASRDEDFATLGEGSEGEDGGGGVVVNDGGGRGAGETGQEGGDEGGPAASGTGFEVELEVAVSGGGLADVFDGFGGERGPAEAGMEQDSGGVQDGAEVGAGFEEEEFSGSLGDGIDGGGGGGVGQKVVSGFLDGLTDAVCEGRGACEVLQAGQLGALEDVVDGG
jgi:hypothetical protein